MLKLIDLNIQLANLEKISKSVRLMELNAKNYDM